MDKNEVFTKLEALENINTIDSCNEAIELIDKYLKKENEDTYAFEYKRIELNIKLVQLKINDLGTKPTKEEINLRGKLVKLYKQLEKKEVDSNRQLEIRYKGLEELKLHKEAIKKYKSGNKDKISIPEKLGLTILDISKSIEVFLEKRDVITKVKNVTRDTASGTLSVAVITAISGVLFHHFFSSTFTLLNVIKSLPIVAYIGLASIIRNLSSDTPFQQYQYFQSDEYKDLVNKFNEENKELIDAIAKITKEKDSEPNNEKKIAINENLIEKIDELVKKTNIRGVKDAFMLQALTSLRENKELCEQIKEAYLEEENDDKEKYDLYSKKLRKINYELFVRGNSIKDALIDSGKGVVKNTAVMSLAKAIMSCIAPDVFPLSVNETLLEPFIFALINGLIDIPTYKNKLKYQETEYKGKVKLKNKKRIEEILEIQKQEPVLA